MKQIYYDALVETPIIAALKDDTSLEKCLKDDSLNIVFILYGSAVSIIDIVDKIKASGKIAFVHMDLISGLSSRTEAVDFIAKYTKADGIISTRPEQMRRAKELDLCTIFRIFAIDSKSLEKARIKNYTEFADAIEVLPGLMPSIITKLSKTIAPIPLIAGGLISEKHDIINALNAGAISISTTTCDVWNI